MPLNLRHVRQPTDRKSEELAVERARDGLSDGGFADTGRTGETDDFALDCAAQLAYSKEFEDALLDVFQPVVVVVEDLGGVGNRVVFGGVLAPGNLRTNQW